MSQVKVDKVLRLVSNIRAEIAAHYTMPSGIVPKIWEYTGGETYFLSNSFLTKAAISFSILYFSRA